MLRGGRSLIFPRIATMGLLPAVALSLAGCQSYPAPPTQTFTPKIVGVIAEVTIDTSVRTRLTDGRIIDQSRSTAYHLFGSWGQPGWLLLADTSETGFTKTLPTFDNGWEAWQSNSSDPIAWDMGDSVLFSDGVELRKAAGFYAEEQAQTIDGRSAWVASGWSDTLVVLANGQGELTRLRLLG